MLSKNSFKFAVSKIIFYAAFIFLFFSSLASSGYAQLMDGSSTQDCLHWYQFEDAQNACLLDKLRSPEYFGITPDYVSNAPLLAYIEKNRKSIITHLTKVDVGWGVKGFLALPDQFNNIPSENEFINLLNDSRPFLQALTEIKSILDQSLAWHVISQSIDVYTTMSDGLKVYKKFVGVLAGPKYRIILQDYIAARIDQNGAERRASVAWSDISKTDQEFVNLLVNLNKFASPTQLGTQVESDFQAYRLVGYSDSADVRYEIGKAIAYLAAPSISLIFPREDDTWILGNEEYISWSYTGVKEQISPLDINLLKGGVFNKVIKSRISAGKDGKGSLKWIVPLNQAPGTDYQIRIFNSYNSSYESTSKDFIIRGKDSFALRIMNFAGGSVLSSPAGINCGESCAAIFSRGRQVTLSAIPDAGWIFVGWSESSCPGLNTCSVIMDQDKYVMANFMPKPPPSALVSSNPLNGASNVGLSSRSVSWTFSQAMAPAQDIVWEGVDPSQFSYSWSSDGKTLTATYSKDLPSGVSITWKLNTTTQGFKDLAGNMLPATVGSFSTITGIGTGSAWPMFGHDAQHTRQSTYIGPQTNNLKWSISLGFIGSGFRGPSLGNDGTLYAGSSAINLDGSLKFYTSFPDAFNGSAISSDGTIYTSNGNLTLVAFNPDGTIKWTYSPPNTPGFSDIPPALGSDGTIYCTFFWLDYTQKLFAFNPDGTEKWSYQFSANYNTLFVSSPAIGPGNIIYVVAGGLFAFNHDGSLKWRYTEPSLYGDPSVAPDGTVYVTSRFNVVAINPNGSMKWTKSLRIEKYPSSVSIGYDGTIYLLGVDPTLQESLLYSLDANGIQKWSLKFPEGADHPPTIGADGLLYIKTRKNIYAINSDGTLKWQYEFPNSFGLGSEPIIDAYRNLYVVHGYDLYCF